MLGIFSVISLTTAQQYVIQRDTHRSYQFNSFTVFTPDEREMIYRVETQYSLAYAGTIRYLLPLDDSIIVASIDAFLGSDRTFNFRLLDPRLGRWVTGRVYQRNGLVYVIELPNFQQMIMELPFPRTPEMSALSTVRFRDARIPTKIYADYTQRTPWLSAYDLRLFSNEYPVELYLAGFALAQRRG